jgi:hypothetical protein
MTLRSELNSVFHWIKFFFEKLAKKYTIRTGLKFPSRIFYSGKNLQIISMFKKQINSKFHVIELILEY